VTWPQVKIENFCRPKQWPTISQNDLVSDGYPVYGANGQIGWYTTFNHEHETLLITCRGATCGTINVCPPRTYVTGNAMALDDLDESRVTLRYLVYALTPERLRKAITGSAQPQITRESLRAVSIPLPPLREQRRIAAILDHAGDLRAKRDKVIADLDELVEATFLDMFGGYAGHCATVEEISAPEKGSIRTGPFGSQLLHSEFVDEGVAVLGLDNVVGNTFGWGERRYITPEKYEKLKRYTVRPGDVLVSIMGTCGRCVVVPADVGTAINTKHICAVTLDRTKAVPEYVRAAFLWHPASRLHLTQRTKGSIMDGLNMGIVKEMPVPLPHLDEQHQFVARLRAIEQLHRACADSFEKVEALFESVQMSAFSGQL
jgi:type I restriction enzyme, S subunit